MSQLNGGFLGTAVWGIHDAEDFIEEFRRVGFPSSRVNQSNVNLLQNNFVHRADDGRCNFAVCICEYGYDDGCVELRWSGPYEEAGLLFAEVTIVSKDRPFLVWLEDMLHFFGCTGTNLDINDTRTGRNVWGLSLHDEPAKDLLRLGVETLEQADIFYLAITKAQGFDLPV
jgi:hypothetical protein